jgi:hypothetical protein
MRRGIYAIIEIESIFAGPGLGKEVDVGSGKAMVVSFQVRAKKPAHCGPEER